LDVGGVFVANPEDYGAYSHWGRTSDGHESSASSRYPTDDDTYENGVVSGTDLDASGQVSSSSPAYGKFIKLNTDPYDWRTPQTDTLWYRVGGKTVNDPCPSGWRVPTLAELSSLGSGTWANWNSTGINGRLFGTTPDTIFLPAAGFRKNINGTHIDMDTYGYYWSSTARDGCNDNLTLYSTDAHAKGSATRAFGFSVRCVAEP
jgi:uncharacterized protein (TIGR02145 family)